MKQELACGMRAWNWGGTWHSQKSLYAFKSGWGTVDEDYCYMVSASPLGANLRREHSNVIVEKFPFYYKYSFDRTRDDSGST